MADKPEKEKKEPSKEVVKKGDDFFNVVNSVEKANSPK